MPLCTLCFIMPIVGEKKFAHLILVCSVNLFPLLYLRVFLWGGDVLCVSTGVCDLENRHGAH